MTILEEATSTWSLDAGVKPPLARDAAKRIRAAMEACRNGIGALAAMIAPVDLRNDSLFSTGARTEGEWVIAGWSTNESHEEISALPANISVPGPFDGRRQGASRVGRDAKLCTWFRAPMLVVCPRRSSRPTIGLGHGGGFPASSEKCSRTGSNQSRCFDQCARVLVTEAAWETALRLLHYGHDHAEPIPVQSVAEALPLKLNELMRRSREMRRTTIADNWREIDVTMLGAELARLEELQVSALSPLLPMRDLNPEGRARQFLWLYYSESQVVNRVSRLLQLAIEAYSAIGSHMVQAT